MNPMDWTARRRVRGAIFAATLAALLVNAVVAWQLGWRRPMTSDAEYFLDIAVSVAEGRGYRLDHGFWSGAPTASRMPGWPLLVAAALRLSPGGDPNVVMRVTAVVANVIAAGLVALLAWCILRKASCAAFAGLGFALNPTAAYLAYEGMSEPFFIVLVAGGVILTLEARWSSRFAGLLLLGLACLVRAQFVLWIGLALPLAGLCWWRRGGRLSWSAFLRISCGLVIFVAPLFVWTARNATVSGRFPLVSTIRGQTFYGGNNPIVADTFGYWGYWVFPDDVPGETPMAELSKTLDEFEVDAYYYEKGRRFIREHAAAMPRLWLGKLVRAYVPIPWKPSMGTWAVNGYRWVLYGLALMGFLSQRRAIPTAYGVALAGVAFANVVPVLMFWGCARFAFPLEVFLLPVAGLNLNRVGARSWASLGTG